MTAPQTRAEVADHLDAAADILLEKGLARHAWQDGEGRICSNEAIALSLTGRDETIMYRSSGRLNQMCPTTLKAFALYLVGRVVGQEPCGDVASALIDPANLIIEANDNTNEDMADAMRHCAKYLREHDVPDRQD